MPCARMCCHALPLQRQTFLSGTRIACCQHWSICWYTGKLPKFGDEQRWTSSGRRQGVFGSDSALVRQQGVPDGLPALLLDEDVEGVADEELALHDDLRSRREQVPMLQPNSLSQ